MAAGQTSSTLASLLAKPGLGSNLDLYRIGDRFVPILDFGFQENDDDWERASDEVRAGQSEGGQADRSDDSSKHFS